MSCIYFIRILYTAKIHGCIISVGLLERALASISNADFDVAKAVRAVGLAYYLKSISKRKFHKYFIADSVYVEKLLKATKRD